MVKAITLRHVKEHNADPAISFNLKFRNLQLNMYRVGYVIGYDDGSYRHIMNKLDAEALFATEVLGCDDRQEWERQYEYDEFGYL